MAVGSGWTPKPGRARHFTSHYHKANKPTLAGSSASPSRPGFSGHPPDTEPQPSGERLRGTCAESHKLPGGARILVRLTYSEGRALLDSPLDTQRGSPVHRRSNPP